MIPLIARNLFNLQELLLGRPSFSILRELNESQWWPHERLNDLRLERLQRIIRIAHKHTAYWREVMNKNGIRPSDIRSLDDLRKFPLLEKQTLREQRRRISTPPECEDTSGSGSDAVTERCTTGALRSS
jgi:phenylacetate-CoA ligase